MKDKILLKSFFLLALIFAISSQVYASEVTGNLSSSGVTSAPSTGGSGGGGGGTPSTSSEVSGTLGNGTITGTVSGGSTSSGGGGGGGGGTTLAPVVTGSVLGASTTSTINPIATSTKKRSTPARIALVPATDSLAQSGETYVAPSAEGAVLGTAVSADTTSGETAVTETGFSIGVWFWIILLLLLLLAVIYYIYSHRSEEYKTGVR